MAITGQSGGLFNSTALTVKIAQSTAGGGAARMDTLEDVREVSKANNNILVYDGVRDLFILEAPNADGGTF
jgi:threonine aldolase